MLIKDDANASRLASDLNDKYAVLHQALGELGGYLQGGNLQAFLDQPTQCVQHGFLGARNAFLAQADQTRTQAATAIKHEIPSFEVISTLLLAIVAAIEATHFGIRRVVVQPQEVAGRHFDAIAVGDLMRRIDAHGTVEIRVMFVGLVRMQSRLVTSISTDGRPRGRSTTARVRFPPATRTCRSARNSRPPRLKRPPRAWNN